MSNTHTEDCRLFSGKNTKELEPTYRHIDYVRRRRPTVQRTPSEVFISGPARRGGPCVLHSALSRDPYCYARFPPPPHGAAHGRAAGRCNGALGGAEKRTAARRVK